MTTLPTTTPAERAAALGQVFGVMSKLDLYSIIAAAMNELDRRGEDPLPSGNTVIAGASAAAEWDGPSDCWVSGPRGGVDPDDGNVIRDRLILHAGVTRVEVPVNLVCGPTR